MSLINPDPQDLLRYEFCVSMITWTLRTGLIQPSPFRLVAIEPWAKEQSKATASNFCHSCLYTETESRISVNSCHIRHLPQALPGLVQAPPVGTSTAVGSGKLHAGAPCQGSPFSISCTPLVSSPWASLLLLRCGTGPVWYSHMQTWKCGRQ